MRRSIALRRKVADPHFHVWSLATHEWLRTGSVPGRPEGLEAHIVGDLRPMQRDYPMSEYAAESSKYHLAQSVHIQVYHDDPIEETRQVFNHIEEWGHPTGIVAYAELEREDIEEQISTHLSIAGDRLKGIRQIIDWHPIHENRRLGSRPDLMMLPSFHKGLKVLENNSLSFDLQFYPPQMEAASVMAGLSLSFFMSRTRVLLIKLCVVFSFSQRPTRRYP